MIAAGNRVAGAVEAPTDQLSRADLVMLALLAVLALAINADRFVLGADGPLRAHDLADQTITAMGSCGEFWRSGLQSAWDPTQLRGWPRAGSPMHAEMLMCVVGGLVPLWYIGPIFHALILLVIATGTYLFVRVFLRHPREIASAACGLHVLLYFFFHEHPIVPSAILLPSLVGFLALPAARLTERLVMIGGAVLVLGLSNPPPTLILMPLAHAALILTGPRETYRRSFVRWVLFWTAYALYYAPMMIALLREFESSSRSLYRPPAITGSFAGFFSERLINPAVLSPAAVLVALVGRRTWLRTVAVLAGIVGFIALTAANDVLVQRFGRDLPVLVSMSSLYYRMYYLVPVALLVWACWLLRSNGGRSTAATLRASLLTVGFCITVWYFVVNPMRVFLPYWKYAAVIGGMAVTLPWWTRRTATIALTLTMVFAWGRYEFTRIYEVPRQGNLFIEPPWLGQRPEPVRAVTIMPDCDAVHLYPAQARAAGFDTMDGISNYYARGYVERWASHVANTPGNCTARYAGWSTRAELTVADLQGRTEDILSWLWINNVAYVRSPVPIADERLALVADDTFVVDRTHLVRRYLYRFASPVGAVFTMPKGLAEEAVTKGIAVEATLVARLVHEGVKTLPAVRVNGSRWRFTAAASATELIVANMNYHPGWQVRRAGSEEARPVRPGPFGMALLPIDADGGVYELEFTSRTTPLVPAFMLAAVLVLWFGARYEPSRVFKGGGAAA